MQQVCELAGCELCRRHHAVRDFARVNQITWASQHFARRCQLRVCPVARSVRLQKVKTPSRTPRYRDAGEEPTPLVWGRGSQAVGPEPGLALWALGRKRAIYTVGLALRSHFPQAHSAVTAATYC